MTSSGPRLSSEDKEGLLILGICAVIGLAIMGSALTLKLMRVEVDDETLCPVDGTSLRHLVVLVDKTDFLTPNQVRELRSEVDAVRDGMNTHERLTLSMITDQTDLEMDIVFSLCKPDDGRAATILYQNPKRIQHRFDAAFGEPLAVALQGLLRQDERSRSPLVESIRLVSEWQAFSSSPQRGLIIVSDLLQHTPPQFSHYQNGRSPGGLEAIREVDLRGAELRVRRLIRPGHRSLQNDAHEQEWMRLFLGWGAHVEGRWIRDLH